MGVYVWGQRPYPWRVEPGGILPAIVNAGWSRGTKIPRQGRWYDPFCPKILGILGKTKLPRTIASRSRWCRSLSPIQTDRGTNIAAEVQSPKTKSRRCCETMIFVPSSFIRLSEPISRGTVTGQRNSRTRSRASCPTSRTSEHSSAGATGCDVRMFGCLPLDGPHREGGLLAGLRTY